MKSLFAKLFGWASSVLSFYSPILKQATADGLALLLPFALEIVSTLAESRKSGAQKRDIAVKKLTNQALEAGIEASESLIRFTIESAVQKLKLED